MPAQAGGLFDGRMACRSGPRWLARSPSATSCCRSLPMANRGQARARWRWISAW